MHLFSYPLFRAPPYVGLPTTSQLALLSGYNIVYDLTQKPTAMSALEVLKTFPMQRKALPAALGVVDPSDSKLITFDIDNGEP